MSIKVGHFLLFLIAALTLTYFLGFWVIVGLTALLIIASIAGK